MSDTKYPNVVVQLVGTDGNAFALMGQVVKGLREAGVPSTEHSKFQAEAMSGDYDNLLATCMRWVTCE